ncbi:hypothetical protein DL95DRAFT_321991 [Leptodontidium sp. 2 PMI_412]|nr:hypothetical protein DL95DRAFT_321991 [Leptodontidium sp. 2 PMI_412]
MSTFHPNCTLPHSIVNFVSAPNSRGTLNLLWSSLSVIILCVWTVHHLNVPVQILPGSTSQMYGLKFQRVIGKTKWMLLMVLAPELLLGKALVDLLSALHSEKDMKDLADQDGAKWTITHAYFANMGGFYLHLRDTAIQTTGVEGEANRSYLSTGTQEGPILKDSFGKKLGTPSTRHGRQTWCLDNINQRLANTAMDSLMEREPSLRLRSRQRNLMALQGNFWVLDAAQLRLAREFGVLEHLPQISEHDLEDQNKGDALVKALAVAQSLWLIVQLLVRFAKHLPSSQLELMAAAFAGCSSFTYVLFWFKPKDVGQPRHFRATRYPTAEEVLAIAMEGPTTFFHYREDRYPRISFLIGSVTGAIIFGFPHLFAWNFAFPTTIERLIWRIAAVLAVVLPVVGLVVDLIFSFFYKRKARHAMMPGHFQRKFLSIISKIIWTFSLSYFLVRIYMMVEVFRSLFYLPPRVFRTTWSSSIPHNG